MTNEEKVFRKMLATTDFTVRAIMTHEIAEAYEIAITALKKVGKLDDGDKMEGEHKDGQ